MRAHIILNEGLVAKAMRYANVKTKRELVDLAFLEVAAARRREAIVKLFGNIQIDPAYDWRPMRSTQERRSGVA
jgi:Arc/MetJ family transcription regulator